MRGSYAWNPLTEFVVLKMRAVKGEDTFVFTVNSCTQIVCLHFYMSQIVVKNLAVSVN